MTKAQLLFWLALGGAIFAGCERSVVIESPFPEKAVYCDGPESMEGDWSSDSVWVFTKSDSLDSVLVNRSPTFFYDLSISCDLDTIFLMEYTNFSGVVTNEFESNNYEILDSTIVLYSELDLERNGSDSTGGIKYVQETDTTLFVSYAQRLNADQANEIRIWFKR